MRLGYFIEILSEIFVAIPGSAMAYSIVMGPLIVAKPLAAFFSVAVFITCFIILTEGWVMVHKDKTTEPFSNALSPVGAIFVVGGTCIMCAGIIMFPIFAQFSPAKAVVSLLEFLFLGLGLQLMLFACKGVKEGLRLITSIPDLHSRVRAPPYGLSYSCIVISIAFCAANSIGMYQFFMLIKEPIVRFLVPQ